MWIQRVFGEKWTNLRISERNKAEIVFYIKSFIYPYGWSSYSGGPVNMQTRSSVSQRGLLSISMLLFSVGGLSIAMLAGAKLVFDIFDVGLLESLMDYSSR